MASFNTLPAEVRVQIYRYVFEDLQRLKYIPYTPVRYRWYPREKQEPLSISNHVSILFVSRKILEEARAILANNFSINIEQIDQYGWRSHPGNTNFKIGTVLRHVLLPMWPCKKCLKLAGVPHGTKFDVPRILKMLQKLPVLSSIEIELKPAKGGDYLNYHIQLPLPEGFHRDDYERPDGFEPHQLEKAVKGGLAEFIVGRHCQQDLLRAALRESAKRDCPLAVKASSVVEIQYEYGAPAIYTPWWEMVCDPL